MLQRIRAVEPRASAPLRHMHGYRGGSGAGSRASSTRSQQQGEDFPELYHYPRRKTNWGINTCEQGHHHVVQRFGKFSRVVESGLYFAWPFIDTIVEHDMREMTIPISPQTGVTRDNVCVLPSWSGNGGPYTMEVKCVGVTFSDAARNVHARTSGSIVYGPPPVAEPFLCFHSMERTSPSQCM
jgi:hypothetical protein